MLPRLSPVAVTGLALALAAGLALALAGPGYRLGWWPLATAFTIFRWSAYAGLAGAVIALAGAFVPRSVPIGGRILPALFGIIIGALVASIPWQWSRMAQAVPRIHDVSTDLENPPAFEAILPLRAGAPNPAEHPGEEIAELQRAGYPDLEPLVVPHPVAATFDHALAVARDMAWDVVAADPLSGRIEATDTTFWFRFKDDVVVRVRAVPEGSRVDVRSVSRIGRSDVGTNARRIRRYFDLLSRRIEVARAVPTPDE